MDETKPEVPAPHLDHAVLEHMLSGFLDPQRAQAVTQEVRAALNHPQIVPLLMDHLAHNPRDEIRHLSAVILRKCILKGYSKLSFDDKAKIKEILKQRVVQETVHLVRVSIAHVISRICRVSLNEWGPDLMQFLDPLSVSPEAGHREVAQIVLHAVIDSMGSKAGPYFNSFAVAIEKGLTDAQSDTCRLAAVKGLVALSSHAENDAQFATLRNLLKALVDVISHAVDQGNEDIITYGMDILDSFAECNGVFTEKDLVEVALFCIRSGARPSLSPGARSRCFFFIDWLAANKPKVFSRNPALRNEMYDVIVALGSEATSTDDGGDDGGDDETTPSRIGAQLLDSIALNIPSKYVFMPMLEKLHPLTTSPNPLHKKCALLLVGIMSEGCSKPMREHLPKLLPFVFASFTDPAEEVRTTAGLCVEQMADYLQPDISFHHEQAFPCLLNALNTPSPLVQEKVCYSITSFIENLDGEVVDQYAPVMIPRLLTVFNSAGTPSVGQSAIAALGAFALTCETGFEPFVKEVMTIIDFGIRQNAAEHMGIRGRCTHLASILIHKQYDGPEFAERRDAILKHVLEGLESVDSHELRETSYQFLQSVLEFKKDAVVPILPQIIKWLIGSLLSEAGIEKEYEAVGGDVRLGGDDEEEDEEDRMCRGLSVRAGFFDEQEAALDCVKAAFDNVDGKHISMYIPKIVSALETFKGYLHVIRSRVPGVLQSIMQNANRAHPPPHFVEAAQRLGIEVSAIVPSQHVEKWVAGLPSRTRLHPNVKLLWMEHIWPFLQDMLFTEDTKECLAEVMNCLGDLLEEMGPDLLEDIFDANDPNKQLLDAVYRILRNEHLCQKFDASNEVLDQDDDSRATEEFLYEGLSCLVSGLAATLGGQFEPMFAQMHPHLTLLATHSTSFTYRAIGLGCYTEVIKAMGPCEASAKYTECVFLTAVEGLKGAIEDMTLTRNSCYCVGVLAKTSPTTPVVVANLQTVLEQLDILLRKDPEETHDEDELSMLDNAVSAVGRIFMSQPIGSLPITPIVEKFLSCLPLKADVEERNNILECMLFLYEHGETRSLVEQHVVKFLQITISEVSSPDAAIPVATANKVNAMTATIIHQLGGESSPKVQELVHTHLKNNPKAVNYLRAALTPSTT